MTQENLSGATEGKALSSLPPTDMQSIDLRNATVAEYPRQNIPSLENKRVSFQTVLGNNDILVANGKAKNSERRNFGTKEWASVSVNCITGCSHNCGYCWARYMMAKRFHRVTIEEWPIMRIRPREVKKRHPKYKGTVMFPTTSDITPEVLEACLIVIGNLLRTGNKVLIVTKPHLDCVAAICEMFKLQEHQILWRFTIGSDDDAILKYWEPGAPSFDERKFSLEYAFETGFETSVSIEPMLDAPNIHRLVKCLSTFVTDAIWIGKLNGLSNRVKVNSDIDLVAVSKIRENQSDENIRAIYESLKNNPLIKWKESIKKIVGLQISAEAGADV